MAKRVRGLGYVRAHRGGFEAAIQIGGKRYSKRFEREPDAWSWIATLKSDVVRGVLKVEPKAQELRFDDLCRLYKLSKVKRWREGTARFYEAHLKASLLPAFESRTVSEITTAELQRFLDIQLERVSAMTVSKAQQLLGQIFNYAVRMGYLARSPMTGVERVRPEAKAPRHFRLLELRAILNACTEEQRPFFTVLALTGLRRAEIFRMSWDWVDFDGRKILVKVAKRGSNEMPMSARVKAVLEAMQPADAVGYVFHGAGGPRSMLTQKTGVVERVLKSAGINPKGIGLHAFRHTFITLVEQTGAPYSVVRALARHGVTSRDITARYLHPSDEQLRLALAQVEQAVFGPTNVVLMPQAAGS